MNELMQYLDSYYWLLPFVVIGIAALVYAMMFKKPKDRIRYIQCNKCGSVGYSKGRVPLMCLVPFMYRTSKICGGAYVEISKRKYRKEYKKQNNEKPKR